MPAAQRPEVAVRPVEAQREPEGQATHPLAPDAGCRVPAGQLAQLASPPPAAKVPSEQTKHTLALASAALPATQLAQELAPDAAEKVPAAQSVQEIAAATAYVPTGHFPPAALEPEAGQEEPAGHGTHDPCPDRGW